MLTKIERQAIRKVRSTQQGRESMLQWAVIIFAIGAVGGLVLASSVLRGKLAPWALSLLHAALGATGLVLTAIVVFGAREAVPQHTGLALLLLVIAALGGFFLGSFHLRQRPGAKPGVLFHAGVAVIGFLLLAGGAFQLF
jgi:cation transport ATPase